MTNDFVKKFFSDFDYQALLAEILNENELFGVPDGTSYNVAHLAYTFFKQKKYTQAQIIYEGLVCANPFDTSYHVILGLIYFNTEQKDLARREFEEAVDLDPDSYAAYVARAYLTMEKQNKENESNEQNFN
jgi:tetratricopeptide (TPR) repeat protein